MKLIIDISEKDFTVTRAPEPLTDPNGVQRIDKSSGLPMWTTQLVCVDEDGGDIISVKTIGQRAPEVEASDVVEPVVLVALPWVNNGRNGIAYRADSIILAED